MNKYSPLNTGEYPRILPNFQNCACFEKYLKDITNNTLHLTLKYAQRFVLEHYLLLKAHSSESVTREKTVGSPQQIMSADKYFSHQMEAIVFFNRLSEGEGKLV